MRMSDWSSDVCSSDLFSEIGEGDGLRITTNTRFNFGSGKGAIDADISYPIDRLIGGNLNFYLIGQAFTGYGENLLDYNRRMTRLRLGLDRKSGVEGKRVSVRVNLGGRRIIKKKRHIHTDVR